MQEKDTKQEKIIRDLRTELEDKNRQIGDLEFVRRKEWADQERDKDGGREKVIQELELQKRVGQESERKVGGSDDHLNDLRGELRQAQKVISEALIEREAAIKAAVEQGLRGSGSSFCV
jgi:hypothetical protein